MKRVSKEMVQKGMNDSGIELRPETYANTDLEGNITCACALSHAFIGELGLNSLITVRLDEGLYAQSICKHMGLERGYVSGFVHGFDHAKDYNDGMYDPEVYKAGNEDGIACRVLLEVSDDTNTK